MSKLKQAPIPSVQPRSNSELLIITEETKGLTDDQWEAIEKLKCTPPPPPAKVPIGDCLGKMVDCPVCGKPASVDHARGARTLTQVVSSKWYVLVKCKGYCGSMLRKIGEPVTVMPEPEPVPVFKPLGHVVGHFILCPDCHVRAKAYWTLDDGHVIACPDCGAKDYPGDTEVEVVA